MNDKELAEAVVALGVGSLQHEDGDGECHVWVTPNHCGPATNCHEFVRDWRVAGALMEKLAAGRFRSLDMGLIQRGSGEHEVWGFEVDVDCSHYEKFSSMDESLPRAIISACVSALDLT